MRLIVRQDRGNRFKTGATFIKLLDGPLLRLFRRDLEPRVYRLALVQRGSLLDLSLSRCDWMSLYWTYPQPL